MFYPAMMYPEQGPNSTHLLCLGCKNTYLIDPGTLAARIVTGEIRESPTARMGPIHRYTTIDCTACRVRYKPASLETRMAAMCAERRYFEAAGASRDTAIREAVTSEMKEANRRETKQYRDQLKEYRVNHSYDDHPPIRVVRAL